MKQSTVKPLYTSQFILIWISNFFSIVSLAMFFLFPLFILECGGSKSDIGILMGVMTLASVLSRPLISNLIDKFGRKNSYMVSGLINACMAAIHVFFNGQLTDFYIPLIIVRMIYGIGIGFNLSAGLTFAADIVPSERLNEGLGIFGTAGLVAMAIGPGIGEPIIRKYGFDSYFIVISLFSTLSLLLQFFNTDTYRRTVTVEAPISFFSVLKRRKILSISFLSLFFGTAMATQGSFVAPFAEQLGLKNISIYFFAFSGSAVMTRLFGSKVADRVGEEVVIPWAFVVSAIGYISLIFTHSSWYLLIPGALCGLGHGFVFPCLNSLVLRDEPVDIRGKVSGIFTGAMDGGVFIGSIALGYIGEWFGFIPIFSTTFTFLMVGAVLFVFVLRNMITTTSSQLIY